MALETEPSFPGGGRPSRFARRSAWALIGAIGVFFAVVVIGTLTRSTGDPGHLQEAEYSLPSAATLPVLIDVTHAWGLDAWETVGTSHISGGVAMADLDGDDRLDIVFAGGDVGVFFNSADGFKRAEGRIKGGGREATSVAIADLDNDGRTDIVIGFTRGDAVIVWGGPWLDQRDLGDAETDSISGGEPSTGFVTADLDADGRLDIVRLGYGRARSVDDIVLFQTGVRLFVSETLPKSGGRSFAAETADLDGDGVLDIWVTRDVGWKAGPDSLYVRPDGDVWVDAGPEMGTDLRIDGMGITLADLNGDAALDAYLSDIGDNEILERSGSSFRTAVDTGAARIRPPEADDDVVSSSWASGAIDINLDGVLDLVVVNGGFPFGPIENKIRGTRVALDDPPAVLLGIGEGRFVDVWPQLGLEWSGVGRGLSIGDLDGDGDADLVVTRLGAPPLVYRNDTPGAAVRIVAAAGCSPHGAVVAVAGSATGPGIVQLLGAHSFLGSHASEVIVGAAVPPILVTVTWPGGLVVERTVDVAGERTTIEMSC